MKRTNKNIDAISGALELASDVTEMITKAIPPDEVRIDRAKHRLILLSVEQRKLIIKKSLRFLKKNEDVDILAYVNFILPNDKFTNEDRANLHHILYRQV